MRPTRSFGCTDSSARPCCSLRHRRAFSRSCEVTGSFVRHHAGDAPVSASFRDGRLFHCGLVRPALIGRDGGHRPATSCAVQDVQALVERK